MVPKGGEPAVNMMGFQDGLRRRNCVEDVLPRLHHQNFWYSATWEEALPSINESTFCTHSGPDRFHRFTVILMVKRFVKTNTVCEELPFSFSFRGQR